MAVFNQKKLSTLSLSRARISSYYEIVMYKVLAWYHAPGRYQNPGTGTIGTMVPRTLIVTCNLQNDILVAFFGHEIV